MASRGVPRVELPELQCVSPRSNRNPRWLRLGSVAALAATLLSGALVVAAADEGDAARAAALLKSIPSAQATQTAVKQAAARAEDALKRARATPAEQAATRKALETSALEWAGAAVEWSRSLERERAASKLEESVTTLRAQLVHARALLEETHARKARAQHLLDERAAEPGADTTTSTSSASSSSTSPATSALPANTQAPPKPVAAEPKQAPSKAAPTPSTPPPTPVAPPKAPKAAPKAGALP